MEIVLQKVSKAYGNKQVLSNLSWQIRQGSAWAVMAPSGAGKTTLLRLILGLEKVDSGTISGTPAKAAVVFQENRLCPHLSALANLRMAVPNCPDAETILQALGLGDSLRKPARDLSGGMARRAALARALACDADILILDEPFTGLDTETKAQAAQTIAQYRRERTLILVTHNREDLELLEIQNVLNL